MSLLGGHRSSHRRSLCGSMRLAEHVVCGAGRCECPFSWASGAVALCCKRCKTLLIWCTQTLFLDDLVDIRALQQMQRERERERESKKCFADRGHSANVITKAGLIPRSALQLY